MNKESNAKFSGKWGFILSAVGSVVGMASISWRYVFCAIILCSVALFIKVAF